MKSVLNMNKLMHGQQVIFDKIVTAKHTITGQDYARSILKATTDEVTVPKKKHLDYLVQCTDDTSISITEMCRLLLDRAHNQNWTIAFKALITIHELMNYGNERFFQYLASDNSSMSLDNFSDRRDGEALHMSKFVRAYGNYVSSKAVSFRIVGYDFCKVKRGANSFFGTLDTTKLFEGLNRLQIQIEEILKFDPTLHDLSNSIITLAYNYMYRDLVRLVSSYNDGVANLLQKYFDMDKRHCHEALGIYKKYPSQIHMINEFFKESESMNVDRLETPKPNAVPIDLYPALEDHLRVLETSKKPPTSPVSPLPKPESRHNDKRKSLPPQHSTFSTTTTTSSSAPPSSENESSKITLGEISAQERKKIIDEERKNFEMLRRSKASELSSAAASAVASRSKSMYETRSLKQTQPQNNRVDQSSLDIIDFETNLSDNFNTRLPPDSYNQQQPASSITNSFNDDFVPSFTNASSSSSAAGVAAVNASLSSTSFFNSNSNDLFSSNANANNTNKPPGFSAAGILEPKKLYNPPPSKSLATLDFSKMSLPPNPTPVYFQQPVLASPQFNAAYPQVPVAYYPLLAYPVQTTNINMPAQQPPQPSQQPSNPFM